MCMIRDNQQVIQSKTHFLDLFQPRVVPQTTFSSIIHIFALNRGLFGFI